MNALHATLGASLALTALLAGCHREPAALRAARSFEPAPRFDRSFWEKERAADSPLWNAARALCVRELRETNTRTPTCKELEIARLEAIAAAAAVARAETPETPAVAPLNYNRLLDSPPPTAHPTTRRPRPGDHPR